MAKVAIWCSGMRRLRWLRWYLGLYLHCYNSALLFCAGPALLAVGPLPVGVVAPALGPPAASLEHAAFGPPLEHAAFGPPAASWEPAALGPPAGSEACAGKHWQKGFENKF